jgi:hypothetical protein
MEALSIKIGGTLSILLGIGHCYFYRVFGWEKELQKISILNTKVLYTIHIFLIPLFFLYGYLSLVYSSELAGGSSLGITLTTFYAFFWLLRTSWQLIYFKPSNNDKSKNLTFLHVFITTYFSALCATYAIPIYTHFFI